MSKIEQTILDGASITQATSDPITNLDSIKQVMVAYKILDKEFTGAALKKLIKRCDPTPSPESIEKLYSDSTDAYKILVAQRKAEKATITKINPNALPGYITELTDESGEPNGSYTLDYLKYSDFLHKHFHIHNLKKNLFVYDLDTGTHRGHVNQIETHVRNTFRDYMIGGKLSESEHETLTHVKSMGCIDDYPFVGKFGTVHVRNGCLNMENGEITPTTPDTLYDYRIETEYKKFPNGTPDLDDFLSQYGTSEPIDVLAKAIWQRAYHDTVKELTIFVGPRDCGKTTLAELIQATLDGELTKRNNVSRTLLHELLQRFGYADLEGKLLNIGDDLPDMFIKNSGRVNELVGSVVRHIEKKGIDGYDAIVTAYYLFTANNLPPLDDDDNVIWGKIHLVQFDKPLSSTRVPRTALFTQTIKEQLLFRAVEKALGYRHLPYTNQQSPDGVRRVWHESSTDVDAFLEDVGVYDEGAFTSLETIKKHYEDWCIVNRKKRHMKYLNKKLQPFFYRKSIGNGYFLKLKPIVDTSGILRQRCADTSSGLGKFTPI